MRVLKKCFLLQSPFDHEFLRDPKWQFFKKIYLSKLLLFFYKNIGDPMPRGLGRRGRRRTRTRRTRRSPTGSRRRRRRRRRKRRRRRRTRVRTKRKTCKTFSRCFSANKVLEQLAENLPVWFNYSGMLCRNRTSRLGQRRGLRPTGGAEPPRRGKRLQLRRGLPGEVQGIDIRNYTTAAVFPTKIMKK